MPEKAVLPRIHLIHYALKTQNTLPVWSEVVVLTCLSLCSTQARTVNLIQAILCGDEGVTQARVCLRNEKDRGVER